MTKKRTIVHLMTVKGEPLKNESGQYVNEVVTVKTEYQSLDWVNFMKTLQLMGYGKVEVSKVVYLRDKFDGQDTPVESDVFDAIAKEVKSYFKPEAVKPLTDDQKRIAELEAKLELLLKVAPDDKPKEDDELLTLRKEYELVTGQKGKGTWGKERIKTEIENAKNNGTK